MWKENLYQPVEVLLREHDEFPIGEHQHSFFEMTYILQGEGTLRVDTPTGESEHYRYQGGSLFLVPPDTVHLFTTLSHSRYIFVRFTEHYVSDFVSRSVGHTLHIRSHFAVDTGEDGKETFHTLAILMCGELERPRAFSTDLLQCYVNSMILQVARCLSASLSCDVAVGNDEDKARYMLQYIQQHIHQPERLRTDALAEKFSLSSVYVGRFFKRHFGEDLHKYIVRSRLRKVEDMLLNTSMSVKEIAARLGFVDPCYLNRVFVDVHGLTPLQFRRKKEKGKRMPEDTSL